MDITKASIRYNPDPAAGGGATTVPAAGATSDPAAGATTTAPAGSTAAPASSIMGNATAPVATDWKSTLSSEWQNHPSLKDFKDLNGLAKSFVSAQAMVGANKLVVPKPDAPQEELDKFYNQLGRPETADKYKYSEIKFPEGIKQDEARLKLFTEKFHQLGLTNKQADELYKSTVEYELGKEQTKQAEFSQAKEAAVNSLKQEWGGDYEKNVNLSKMAVQHFGGEKIIDWINESGMGNDANFIRIFKGIGSKMMEDQAQGHSDTMFGKGPQAAKVEIEAAQADTGFRSALLNKEDPGHKAAQAKWEAMHRVSVGGR